MSQAVIAPPTRWWSRVLSAPRRLSFWMNGLSATLAALLLLGDQLASLAQGKGTLWFFEVFDRFRGELIASCVLIFLGGWIAAWLAGACKGLTELWRHGRPSKMGAGVLLTIALLIGGLAILAVNAARSYNENRSIAWRRYEPTLVARAEQALADHHDRTGEFLLRAAAEVEGNHSARKVLDDIEDRKRWSADFWAFYDQVPEGSLARWDLLYEEAPLELNRDRLEDEAERIRSRYRRERLRFVEAVALLEEGQASRAREELKQICNALSWIGHCRVLLRDLETGQPTAMLSALKRYGAKQFSSEMLASADARIKQDLLKEVSERRPTYDLLSKMGLVGPPKPAASDGCEAPAKEKTNDDDQ
jgi:hypothetical protein